MMKCILIVADDADTAKKLVAISASQPLTYPAEGARASLNIRYLFPVDTLYIEKESNA